MDSWGVDQLRVWSLGGRDSHRVVIFHSGIEIQSSHNCCATAWVAMLGRRSLEVLKSGRADDYVGVSLNGGTPKTPQNDHF